VRLALPVLTVRADDSSRAYGANNPVLTVTYSGFVDGEDAGVLSGRPGLSTVAETNSAVGTYPIMVSVGTLSNAHYSLSFTNGTLTVTQAVLTVKADDQTRVYGATNPPLTASYGGFVNGQGTNILSGSPLLSTAGETNNLRGNSVLSTGAETSSLVGPYPITVSQGTLSVADTNYSLAFVEGTLTVVLPAAIVSGPLDRVATNGDTVLFTVTAQGSEPLACQWYFNQTNRLAGATNTTLVLSNVSPAQGGSYAVVVSNLGGTAWSEPAQLTVMDPPQTPCSRTNYILSIVQSATNTLTLTSLGTTNAQYYVLETTNPMADMTNWTVLTDSTNTATNGVWYYTVTNAAGPAGGLKRFFRAAAVNPSL
jgi:hypothetical protein